MSIENLTQELNREKEELAQELAEANRRVRDLNRQLERVEASVAALNGKSARKQSTRKKASRKQASRRTKNPQDRQPPRPEVQLVGDLAAEVLRKEGTLHEAELETRVVELLVAQGQPSSGLHPILKKALVTERFNSSLSGWKLSEILLTGQPVVA